MDMIELEPGTQSGTENDNDSWERIYQCYFRRVYNYLRANVQTGQDAEDLTATVFERVIRNKGAYCREKGSFEVWLFSIAHHALIDHNRKKSRNKSIGMENLETIVADNPDITMELVISDYRRILLKALERLDERERILIALKFWSELKNREIAQLTKLTDENVGVLIFRSIKKLKKILGEMGVHKLYE